MEPENTATDLTMNPAELYREEMFTDRGVGTILRFTPVKSDGSPDDRRRVIYVGQAQLMTPVGALPLSFEIGAGSLEEAVRKFSEAATVAVDHAVEELNELRREAASSIVVPEVGSGGFTPPGGGKIRLR